MSDHDLVVSLSRRVDQLETQFGAAGQVGASAADIDELQATAAQVTQIAATASAEIVSLQQIAAQVTAYEQAANARFTAIEARLTVLEGATPSNPSS